MSIYAIKEVFEKIGGIAEPWDNTGILIDSTSSANNKTIMLTIDLTDEVLSEAISKNVTYIIAYHPIIFTAIKKITDPRLIKCIQNNISVYSPHTMLDPLMNAYLRDLVGESPTFESAVKILKKISNMKTFRVVKSDNAIENIVVGVGAAFREPDFINTLIITGEMSHHSLLKCKRNGNSVILMEHSNSERIFLPHLKSILESNPILSGYSIFISENDEDPVEFI